MPRKPGVSWHEGNRAWRSDVGERNPATGRRPPVYFRELPNTDKGRRQAQALLDAYLADRDRREAEAVIASDPSNPAVGAGVVQPYFAHCWMLVGRKELAERTATTHEDRLGRFLVTAPLDGPHAGVPFAGRLVRSLDDDDAARLVAALRADGCGPRRIAGILSSVHACFNWAAAPLAGRTPRRLIPANPFAGFSAGKVPRKARRLPTRVEVAAFFRAARREVEPWTPIGKERPICSGCVRAARAEGRSLESIAERCRRSHNRRAVYDRAALLLCRLQYHAGTRPSELCRATWGPAEGCADAGWTPRANRDPATGQWWGRLVVYGKTTRATGRLRVVPVPPGLARGIERLRARGLHPELVFPRLGRRRKDGSESTGAWDVSALDHKVRGWRDAAGLGRDFVLYAMRHRMYTHAVHRAGLTADQAGTVGGTGGETVRSTYLHADDRTVFDAARRIARAGREGEGG